MRPLELTLRGFRSYADETTIEFDGRGLVGIVGPIGSGKSSLLDAISFALFGKTPKIERDTKSLINQRRDTLHVSLLFDVDGTRWRAVRALRRGGASQHALYRVDDDGDHDVADKAKEMNTEVETILGMDFAAFRRSVLLAQNQFAAFLEATGTDRNQVLKGVFGFDRLDAMRAAAKVRLDGLGAKLQVLASRRASAENDRAELEKKRVALTAAEERSTTLEALRESVDQADGVLHEAERKVQDASQTLAALDAISADVPSRESTEGAFTAARDSATAVDAASRSLGEATKELEGTTEAVAAAYEAAGGRESLQALGDLVSRWESAAEAVQKDEARVAAASAAVERVMAAANEAVAAIQTAEQKAVETREALEAALGAEQEARDALHRAHESDRAYALRGSLDEGHECPVCGQVVTTLPPAGEPGDIHAAETALEAASGRAERARTEAAAAAESRVEAAARAEAATKHVADATEALETATATLDEARARREALSTELLRALGEGDPPTLLADVRSRVAAAEASERTARAAEAAARKQLDEAQKAREQSRADLGRIRTAIVRLAGRLEMELDVGDDPDAIEAALVTLREHWLQRHAEATERREAATREVEAARAARTDLFEKAGMAAADDIVEITTSAAREATTLGAEVAVLERNLATLDELAADEKDALALQALLDRLHGDLAPSKFLEFLLDERRRVLADLASEHLETLTAGRYRFTDDGEFEMIDLAAADMVRSPASLSGGETFLASLALALALSEIVSREGGRLDAFFLDEGFGSLDPEHLDLAMGGVERLVTSGTDRLVVVVSHVPALEQRIEDLIVLDRDPVTGVTHVRSGAAAPG